MLGNTVFSQFHFWNIISRFTLTIIYLVSIILYYDISTKDNKIWKVNLFHQMLSWHLFYNLLISIIICPHHGAHLDSLQRVNSPGFSSRFILWWCRARSALSFTDDLTLLYFWTEFNYRLWPQLPCRGYLGWPVVSALHETLLIGIRPMIGRADYNESLHSQYAWACVCLYMRLRRKTDKGGLELAE